MLPGTQEANWEQGYRGGGSFDAIGDLATPWRGGGVNRLACEDCGTVYYSAAAKTLVEQGERCAKCGGRLLYDEDDGPGPVAVSAPEPGNGDRDDD
jgi:DNA-directed RNA polymerase subunit RPC12/RpoP